MSTKKQIFLLNFIRRLIMEDEGVRDPDSKLMIVSVLTVALITDILLVILNINPQVMEIYGILLMGALFLAFRGYLLPARLVIPLGGLAVFTYLMIVGRGIRDISLLGLPVVIIGSGLLFGKPGTLLYGILSVGVIAFLGIVESKGTITNEFSNINSAADYISAGMGIAIITIMQWMVIDRLNENIKKAHRNEEAQRLANEALRSSESRFRALIEESPHGILISDAKGMILLANPFACQLLGYEERELIGMNSLKLVDPGFLARRPLPVDQLLAGKVIQRESILVCRNGEHVHVIGGSRYMPDGRYQYIFQDITDRKQAEAEREALILELEAKNAELEQFTYTVSHDLKSPLVTIRGFLGYLEKDMLAGNMENVQKDIARIVLSTDKMQTLLRELLELSRVGRIKNPSVVIPFNTIVDDALRLVDGQIQDKHPRIKVMSEMPSVYGDHVRLVEVVQNLLDNAIKFSNGYKDPSIEIGTRWKDNEPIFYVSDNGVGIAPEFHERVFGLFNKLNPQADGTGIGLALVKRIIEVHGGRIWIESEGTETGATFCFTLANNVPAP